MAVNGVQNGPVDWGQLVKELSDKVKTENPDLDPSIVLDGNSLIFTATDARTGAVRTEMIELPELDKPLEEMSDEEISQYLEAFASTLDDAIADLEAFIQSIKNAGAPGTGGKGRGENQTIDHTHGKHNSSGAQKTFFDLYALLNLMQQIAQEMRDNAREIRWDQLETQTASIKSQAGHQRHAAVLGAIVGGLTCLVQVGMLGYSGYKAGMAEKAASDTSANQQLTTSRNDLETLNMSDDPQKLDTRISKLGSKLSSEQRNAVDAAFEDPEVTEASQKFETARHNVEVAEETLEANGELSGSFEKEIGDVQGQIDGLMGDLGESLGDLKNAQGLINETKGTLKEVNGKIGEAQQTVDSLQTEIDAAQVKVAGVQDQIDSLDAKLDKTMAERGNVQTKINELDEKIADPGKFGLKESDVAELQRQKGTLETQKSALEQQETEIKAERQPLLEEKASLEEQVTALKNKPEFTRATQELEGLKLQKSQLEGQLSEQMQQRDSLDLKGMKDAKYDLVDARSKQAQRNIDAKDRQITDKTRQLDQTKRAIGDKQTAIGNKQRDISTLEGELQETNQKIGDLQSKIEKAGDLDRQIGEKQGQINELDVRIGHAQEMVSASSEGGKGVAQRNLDSLLAEKNQLVAEKNSLEAQKSQLGLPENPQQELTGLTGTRNQKSVQLDGLKAEQRQLGQELTGLEETQRQQTGELEQLKSQKTALVGEKAKLDSQLKALDEGTAKIAELRAKLETLKEQKGLVDQRIDELNAQLGTEGNPGALRTEMKNTQTAYLQKIDNVVSKYDAKFAEARGNAQAAEDKALKEGGSIRKNDVDYEKIDAQGAAKDARHVRDYAKAKAVQAKAKAGAEDALTQDRDDARQRFEMNENALPNERGYRAALAGSQKWQLFSQAVGMFSGLFQGLQGLATSAEEKEATLEQAEQTEAQQYREETNRLLEQGQELINEVKSTRAALQQAEDQSLQRIINA